MTWTDSFYGERCKNVKNEEILEFKDDWEVVKIWG